MLKAFFNMWRVAELRNKILFTMGMLVIYSIGFFIPLLGVNSAQLAKAAEKASGSSTGNLIAFVSIFTGGSFSQSTIFGLGIMPYISASIIFQLLATTMPALKKLQDEGPAGRQKIQEWTRYATVALCIVQGVAYLTALLASGERLVYVQFAEGPMVWAFWTCGIFGLTGGTIFLMWIGEQIDRYGIGNGISLIITAGIVKGMPGAIAHVAKNFSVSGQGDATYGPDTVFFLIAAFAFVVAGAIIITQGQRRIPIQQAKHTRGRRVYGGQRSYLPLRVNHGGVMPIIFASALMMFPSMLFAWLNKSYPDNSFFYFLDRNFSMQGIPYMLLFVALIYFFAYFWTTVQFQPQEMAKQLRDHGSFIPGLRPGPRTAEYLETVMERITYVGAGFLAIIAVIPALVAGAFKVDYFVAQYLGGTGLLIVVSVMLDFIQRVEAGLLMRNYQGFLGGEGGGKGPRMRGSRG